MTPIICNPTGFCFLLLLTSASSLAEETGCIVPTVTAGETARLEFHLPEDVGTSSIPFYAHLVRNTDQKSDILRCYRPESSADVQCTTKLEGYTDAKVDNSTLKVSVPNVTPDHDDTYLLRVYVNDEPQPPISCVLTVKPKRDNSSLLIIVATTVGGCVLFVIIAAVAACLCIRRKRRNKHYSVPREEKYNLEDKSDPEKEHEETSKSLLHDRTDETSKTRRLTEELEPEESIQHCTARVHDDMRPQPAPNSSTRMLKNTAGSKGEIERPTEELELVTSIQKHCTARVHDDIRPQPAPNTSTRSLKQTAGNQGTIEGFSPGRRREPEQARPSSPGNHTVRVDDALNLQPWYHGGTSHTKAQEMLNSTPTANGLFLVTDSGIDNEFRLKAKFSSGLRTYYIRPGGSGYFIEEGVSFPSVPALIKYYKHNQGPLPALLSLPCKR